MKKDLTAGPISGGLLRFALPMMIGNLLQQLYNVADTLIVGQFLGADALAAVGSSYTLMVFLTSILLGLSMGSGTAFSIHFGRRDWERLKAGMVASFCLIALIAVLLSVLAFLFLQPILGVLQVPADLRPLMETYLEIIFWGIGSTFLYNYFANLLRSIGNSLAPLLFLGASAILNIVLDLLFVVQFSWGVGGAALATVLSQFASGVLIGLYTFLRCPELRVQRRHFRWDAGVFREITHFSLLTCVQQSVMNLGILAVQGRVNSFGAPTMAAFAAAVKIDSFAYMPAQDFGNAFSTFIAQNYGARKPERIRRGILSAFFSSMAFCAVMSVLVIVLARPLLLLFIRPEEVEILRIGVEYLRVEASFYVGIGLLFLLYGYYRAVEKPGMSVVLTVISLGTRVALAYALSALPQIGVMGIWASVPIGWFLADLAGLMYYRRLRARERNLPF